MIRYKADVKIQGIRPEVVAAIFVAEGILAQFSVEAFITSVGDGTHSKKSKHYFGCAFDLRSKDLTPDQKQIVLNELRDALTSEFTVFLEQEGEANEHFHIQFGKKGQVLEWLNPKQLQEQL